MKPPLAADPDIRNWTKLAIARLKKSDRYAAFKLVGPELKEAIIAEMVMSIEVAQFDHDIAIDKFVRLYNHLRLVLMPEYGGGAE